MKKYICYHPKCNAKYRLNQLLESTRSIVVVLDTPERLSLIRVNRTGPLRYLYFLQRNKAYDIYIANVAHSIHLTKREQ
jgi:hypothetical protein